MFSRQQTGANGSGSYAYDAFGRQTAPSTDAPNPAGGDITIGYYDTDAVASMSQGGTTQSFTLDSAGRRLQQQTSDGTTTTTVISHYGISSDNPTWATQTDGSNTVTTQYLGALAGGLSATSTTQGSTTTSSLTLVDPGGSIVATVDIPNTVNGPLPVLPEHVEQLPAVGEAGYLQVVHVHRIDAHGGHVAVGIEDGDLEATLEFAAVAGLRELDHVVLSEVGNGCAFLHLASRRGRRDRGRAARSSSATARGAAFTAAWERQKGCSRRIVSPKCNHHATVQGPTQQSALPSSMRQKSRVQLYLSCCR